MITEATAVTFRQNLGEMLNQVIYRQDQIVINKDGRAVAALVGFELFDRIRIMRSRFDALTTQLTASFKDTPEDVGMVEIEAAIKAERAANKSLA